MSRLMPAAMVALATGVLDDVFGLRPWQKLAGQTLAATLAYMAGFGVYILQGNLSALG
jgi:UDP-N-acetylmuramyl pentapeptide phosphotransferase/UDP-N-acetylglucosamine-1-phosphate transferase